MKTENELSCAVLEVETPVGLVTSDCCRSGGTTFASGDDIDMGDGVVESAVVEAAMVPVDALDVASSVLVLSDAVGSAGWGWVVEGQRFSSPQPPISLSSGD